MDGKGGMHNAGWFLSRVTLDTFPVSGLWVAFGALNVHAISLSLLTLLRLTSSFIPHFPSAPLPHPSPIPHPHSPHLLRGY
jgi:hypothetical protein